MNAEGRFPNNYATAAIAQVCRCVQRGGLGEGWRQVGGGLRLSSMTNGRVLRSERLETATPLVAD
jgi:hypothetical protein